MILTYAFLALFPATPGGQGDVRAQSSLTSTYQAVEKAKTPGEKSIDYLHNPPLDLPDFEPVNDQAEINEILAAVGENVSRLFANLLNISAVEKVQLEKLNPGGKADPSRRFEYLYLCAGAVDKSDPSFDEYRSDAQGHEISQLGLDKGYMLTSGFVSAPLIFHPVHQYGSSFRLLGRQKLNGRDTFVMAFEQIPARSRIPGLFQSGRNVQATFKQGMVWIDARNYQIIHLVSDLLTPLPQIKLDKLGTQIDFDKVQLDQKTQAFWLPVQVIVTVHWDGRVLRNTHVYSDFKLFNVRVSQKIAEPPGKEKAAEETGDTGTPGKEP